MKKIIGMTLALSLISVFHPPLSHSNDEKIEYYKYPWLDVIASKKEATPYPMWHAMTLKEWNDAGQPKPKEATFIPGTTVRKYPFSDDLYAFYENFSHKLSMSEWVAMNYPIFQVASVNLLKYSFCPDIYAFWDDVTYEENYKKITYDQWDSMFNKMTPLEKPYIPGTRIFTYKESPAIIYAQLGTCVQHIDQQQVNDWDQKLVEILDPTVQKFSWSQDLFAVSNNKNQSLTTWLDSQRWDSLNHKAPIIVAMVQGTVVYFKDNKVDLYANVAGKEYALTPAQWDSMGNPSPSNAS